jgi:hypothetical protein
MEPDLGPVHWSEVVFAVAIIVLSALWLGLTVPHINICRGTGRAPGGESGP